MTRAVFVSDVHLAPDEEDKLDKLRAFFKSVVGRGDRLYLVGDIFEYWVSPKQEHRGTYAGLVEALAALSRRDVDVGYVLGNRDYLVDKNFERRSRCRVLGTRASLDLDGRRIVLTHGDTLFSRNRLHTPYRRLMNIRVVTATTKLLPLRLGEMIGKSLRRVSYTEGEPWSAKDLLARAWPEFEAGADALICGHLHQPQKITFENGGRRLDLVVLGDWDCTFVYGVSERGKLGLERWRAT